METLIVKENWKEPIKRSRKIMIGFLIIFFLIGLGAAILSFLNGNNLVASLTILFAIGFVVPLSFIVFLSPIYLIKMFSPNTYEFCCEKGRLTVNKNKKSIINIPYSDYIKTTVVNTAFASQKIGQGIIIEYMKKGVSKKKPINTACFSDEDTMRVLKFFSELETNKLT